MGDMADFAVDQVMDEEDARTNYRTGHMTIEEAYERGFVNELGGDLGTEGLRTRTCRCCGKTGLRWGKVEDKWRLFEGATLHRCPVAPLRDFQPAPDRRA